MATIGVFASIFDQDKRALCVRQNYGDHLWTTPGGRLDPHETPLDGLIREVREEIGAEIAVLGFIGVYANSYKDDLVLNFHARLIGSLDHWQAHDEISDLGFFALQELPQPMTANTHWRLQDAADGRCGIYRAFSDPQHLIPG
ncbi:MAG TPA: NUDIX hydrolase [Dongiaceae bacterium]|nr:NUDIX hydrolase [Dongiaceae bacterium]